VTRRRMLALLAAGALPVSARAAVVEAGRVLAFPRDHGAHLLARTEWWYVTGWLGTFERPQAGFQVTFFRSRTGLAGGNASRFAARQLLFAHAAVTDLSAGTHRHAERIARWSEAPGDALAGASLQDTSVHIGRWRLARDGSGYRAQVDDEAMMLDLALMPTQPLLLQGDAGFSRKGPQAQQASHYVSEPQLSVAGRWQRDGAELTGRAWLDHEWSDEFLHPDAVGWDWIGINLRDGSALTAFQLRRGDGTALWAGGSFRRPGGPVQSFSPQDLRFEPGRRWASAATGARYPVQWTVHTPAGRFDVQALLDAQEMDGRASTGGVYWEGLSSVSDRLGPRVGLGYLEMTGYAGRLQL